MGVPTGGRHQHPTTAQAGASGRSLTPRALVSESGKRAPRAPGRGRPSGRPRAGSPGSVHPQDPLPLTGPPGLPLRGSPDRRHPRYIVSCPAAGATLYPARPPAAAACGREAPDRRGPRVCAPRPPRPGGLHAPLRETDDPSPPCAGWHGSGGTAFPRKNAVNPPYCERKWWRRGGEQGESPSPARRPRRALAAGARGAETQGARGCLAERVGRVRRCGRSLRGKASSTPCASLF